MRASLGLVVCFGALLASPQAFAQACPTLMQAAERLVLVTVPNVTSSAGTMRLYERRADAAWASVGVAQSVNVGTRGVAWGPAFRALAGDGEPVKVEGDKRSPAGFYVVGRPFGFAPSPLGRYLRLTAGHVCVEDPKSPDYNAITSEKALGRAAGSESMGRMPRYRRGLVIDYPTDAAAKAGSCIFIHIWKGPGRSTEGCVTLPEARVAALQRFADAHPTVLAVLPQAALGKFSDCLPTAMAQSH